MKKISILFLVLIFSCNPKKSKPQKVIEAIEVPQLTLEQANKLATLPIDCITVEYPNKLGQTLKDSTQLKQPRELHPAFYGCFDWHSAVHGHWSLVKLLKEFPELENADDIKKLLLQNISKENIKNEVVYFEDNKTYERTYGWAWLLKLAEELYTWNDPFAKELESNLKPLANLIAEQYIEFLPKLQYPIRVGTHTNTAFGLYFALEYANATNNQKLKNAIVETASRFYSGDTNCPIKWEPSGYDFLSPCLEEAALMKDILDKKNYIIWLKEFLPQVFDTSYNLEPGIVSDRQDGHLVHLDGVNFSRAWCLFIISEEIEELNHLNTIAAKHINYSLPNLIGDSYEGGHWLGSFAIYALSTSK